MWNEKMLYTCSKMFGLAGTGWELMEYFESREEILDELFMLELYNLEMIEYPENTWKR